MCQEPGLSAPGTPSRKVCDLANSLAIVPKYNIPNPSSFFILTFKTHREDE